MDTLLLSRLQFAVATIFHFFFVPLTLGLSVIIALMETKYARTGDEDYRRMAKFWGKIFLMNFAVGVVTGITLEFQFGTNWSRYSEYVGDIFGSLLAIEATAAFFLESTFIAVWHFGWKKLSPKAHAACIWVVSIASSLSAVWILIANSWMQHPVGYTLRNGRAELTDFMAVVIQKHAIFAILHTLAGAFIVGGFFVMGVSAWYILRNREKTLFTKSFRLALGFALIFSVMEVALGHIKGESMTEAQPIKLAAAESHWETGTNVPMYLILIPDPENERNAVQALAVPGMLSFMAKGRTGAEVVGLKDVPREDRPPVWPVFLAFRGMVGLGFLFAFLTILGWLYRNRLEQHKSYLRFMLYAIPLPYIACQLGWIVTELGRQPWIVYHVMRTSDAVSPVAPGNVLVSLIAFTVVYSLLGALNFYLIVRFIKNGPEPAGGKEAAA